MHLLVGCDQLKIVREGLRDHLPAGEVVPRALLLPPDVVDQGLEGGVEHDGAQGVAGKDAVLEEERVGPPLLGDHHPLQLGVQAPDVLYLLLWDVIEFQDVLNQWGMLP